MKVKTRLLIMSSFSTLTVLVLVFGLLSTMLGINQLLEQQRYVGQILSAVSIMRADIILHSSEPVEDEGARWVSAQRELTDLLLYPPGLALEQGTLLKSIERSNEGLVRLQGYLVGIQMRQKGFQPIFRDDY